jgi:hypothetical protein
MVGDFLNDSQQITHYDQNAEATSSAQDAPQAPIQEAQQQPNENVNWKRMREENERYKREADDLRKQLESRVGDDELVEQRHLKQIKQQLEQQTLELRVKSKCPDFDDIVNSKSLEKLAKEDPELAYTLDSTSDMYAKAISAYKIIKAKQPREEAMPTEEDEMFEENQYKPRNTNTLYNKQDSALGKANAFQRGLSQEQKDTLWKEMQEAIKNR